MIDSTAFPVAHLRRPEPRKALTGSIRLEGSKSISNRALILQALAHEAAGLDGRPSAEGLEHLSISNDTRTLQALLASDDSVLDTGAAGTTYRFLTAWLARGQRSVMLTGSARMLERPIGILVDALQVLGASIEYRGEPGYPPLQIEGKPLKGGKIKIRANVSSQYISALLLIGPTLEEGLSLTLTGKVGSRPYIEMTLRMMHRFGARSKWEGDTIRVEPGGYKPTPFSVEGDWSAASYYFSLLALAPAGSRLEIQGLEKNSLQGDAVLPSLYAPLGVSTRFVDGGIVLRNGGAKADALFWDFSDCPDLAQTVAVTCAGLGKRFEATGLESLAIKETDRTAALRKELKRFGVRFHKGGMDTWVLEGKAVLPDSDVLPTVKTYEDHRMAMAFAPLAMVLSGLQIEEPDVVGKSYPTFWRDWASLGMPVRIEKPAEDSSEDA